MKLSSYLFLTSIAAASVSACAGIWSIAMILSESGLSIPLLVICIFLLLVSRVQLQDARTALQFEQRREQDRDTAQWQFENITGPRL